MPRPEMACGLLEVDFCSSAQKCAVATGVLTPSALPGEIDAAVLATVLCCYTDAIPTQIGPIRARTKDLLNGLMSARRERLRLQTSFKTLWQVSAAHAFELQRCKHMVTLATMR